MEKKLLYIEVRDSTGDVIKRLDVTGKSQYTRDNMQAGINKHLPKTYTVHPVESETVLPIL